MTIIPPCGKKTVRRLLFVCIWSGNILIFLTIHRIAMQPQTEIMSYHEKTRMTLPSADEEPTVQVESHQMSVSEDEYHTVPLESEEDTNSNVRPLQTITTEDDGIHSLPKTCHFELPAAPDGHKISYEISIFYHIGMLKNWRMIVMDQLDTLERCGLGYLASDITVSFFNPSPNLQAKTESTQILSDLFHQYKFITRMPSHKVTFLDATNEYPYEKVIMNQMATVCRNQTYEPPQVRPIQRVVFYLHNKGCSHFVEHATDPNEFETYINAYHWRKYMEYFVLERPTLCTRAILHHGAKTCGVNLRKIPSMHYSGNFWAASCAYIAQLPSGEKWARNRKQWDWYQQIKKERNVALFHLFKYIAAELWVGNFTDRKVGDEHTFLTLFNVAGSLHLRKLLPQEYTWIVSDQTFYQGNHSSNFYDPDPNMASYETGYQVDLWLDYLNGLQSIIPKKQNNTQKI